MVTFVIKTIAKFIPNGKIIDANYLSGISMSGMAWWMIALLN